MTEQNMKEFRQPVPVPQQLPDGTSAVRILYIDENVALSQLFQRKLTNFGYQIDLAHTGEQGLRLAL
ncbi:MAG: response regulator, partial [Anaerolineales bacterium]|nr:response regulator [Anaerolineales bacterium]